MIFVPILCMIMVWCNKWVKENLTYQHTYTGSINFLKGKIMSNIVTKYAMSMEKCLQPELSICIGQPNCTQRTAKTVYLLHSEWPKLHIYCTQNSQNSMAKTPYISHSEQPKGHSECNMVNAVVGQSRSTKFVFL